MYASRTLLPISQCNSAHITDHCITPEAILRREKNRYIGSEAIRKLAILMSRGGLRAILKKGAPSQHQGCDEQGQKASQGLHAIGGKSQGKDEEYGIQRDCPRRTVAAPDPGLSSKRRHQDKSKAYGEHHCSLQGIMRDVCALEY